MDGWMDGWMDGRMDGFMDGWMDGRTHGWMDGSVSYTHLTLPTNREVVGRVLVKSSPRGVLAAAHSMADNSDKALYNGGGVFFWF